MTCSGMLSAATSILNSSGGSNTSNGLKVYIDDSTQIQVQRLDSSGQLFDTIRTPPHNRLDNGIYLRSNGTIYGPDHFAYSAAGSYTGVSVSTVVPTAASQGVAQTTTSKFTVPYNSLTTGPQVSIAWSYTYPFDFVTANVTITIPLTYPVSSSNPVRYYHVVDTYLGGSDCGCGVRYVDTNGKQVAGTYPWAGSCSSGSTSTGVSCPSSTTLPANLNVVESFRERNGSFSRYCVGNWQTFWSNSNTDACAIGKTNQLSSTVNTTLTDTGAAIEYDFTAAGVYTFSYDFVVGSTTVPDYDHLEIRHAGTSSLCPFEVKVLACLSSTVPCPDNQLVSSGDLYGDLLPASSSSLTKTPERPVKLGSANTIDTFTYQSSTATTYTLGVNNLTKAPLNGVKCWNTATNSQSCSFVVTNVPCVNTFECMENTLTYNNRTTNSALRNPLYTKAMGANFDLDVVALLTSGAQSSGYNSTTGLTVQLVDASSGTCGATVVASKTVSFAASDGGRKKVTFTPAEVSRPHPNLRCKVTDTGLVKTGCSSDNFAIRPSLLAVTSVSPLQSSPSNTSAPVRRAGVDNFSVTVSTNELTYTGTPKVDSGKLDNHASVTSVGQVGGSFAAAILGISTGTTFTYSEVGHFRFKVEGVYDDTYAAVDIANGDCDNSFENAGVGTPKRFGCKFGNTTVSDYIGRFIPDHFKVTAGSTYTDGCGTFTYYEQDPGLITPFVLEAKNAADVTTQYYTGTYAPFDLSNWANYFFELKSATTNLSMTNGATLVASSQSPSGSWGLGVANVRAAHKITRPSSAAAPETIKISAQPRGDDGGVTVNSTRADVFSPSVTKSTYPGFRFGRLAVTPAHGSELLPLTVPVEAQYWNGAGYVRNIDDSCTAIPISSIAMKNYKGNLNACETQLSLGSAMNKGLLNLRLSAPGLTGNTPNTGSVDLEVNLSTASAGEMACTSASQSAATSGSISWFGNTDPVGRATFGIYKAPIIYMRENF